MSRTSLNRTWELFNTFHSGLAYHNTMYQCMAFYWNVTGNYTTLRFRRYEPAEIPF